MMYCRYCANQIDDRAARCPYCGRDQYAQPPMPPQYPGAYAPGPAPAAQQQYYPGTQDSQVIYHSGYNTKIRARVIAGLIGSGVFLLLAVIALIVVLTEGIRLSKDDKLWFYIVIVSGFIGSIVTLIVNSGQIGAVNATTLNVTRTGIYGSGGPARYNSIVPFNLNYSQILKVSSLPNHLVIDTPSGKVYCLVENPKEAEFVIDRTQREFFGFYR